MVKFQVETLLACDAAMYIADKDTPVYKKFHMEKLGTLESEVLSHEVVDGRVKVVVRTVPGMKLPRVVRPVLRGKEVEFVDTRTFAQRDKGKLPFAQTFRTVNNITERASVAGTIVIDRAPVPVGPTHGSSASATRGRTMMGTVVRVQGECVVRIAGVGGKVESIIVQNLMNAYKKLPEIVGEWVATRETRLALYEGFPGRVPGGIEPAPSLGAGSVSTTVSPPRATPPGSIRESASAESEGSGSDSAGSFHSAASFSLGARSDETRLETERGWGGRGGEPRAVGGAADEPFDRALSTPSFAGSGGAPQETENRGADAGATPRATPRATPVASGLTPHAFESDSPLETPELFINLRPAASESRKRFDDGRAAEKSDGDIDSADERRYRGGAARPSRARGRRAPSAAARASPERDGGDRLPGERANPERGLGGEKGGGLSAVARWCCCAPNQLGSPLLDDAGAGADPAARDGSARSLSSSPGAEDAAALAWSPADDADLRTPLTPGTRTKRRSRR